MTTTTEPLAKSLPMILKEQPYLYDLHTHLLGMGNPGFWIDTVLMDEHVMPTNSTFKHDQRIREAFCPLVWQRDDENHRSDPNEESDDSDDTDVGEVEESNQAHRADGVGFINNKEVAEFFHVLVGKNIFRTKNGKMESFETAVESLKKRFSSTLWKLIDKKLYQNLKHGGLEFKDDFSYDVILTIEDLCKGLGITNSSCEGFAQLAISEKLGGNLPNRSIKFQHWIIFNAKKQKFEIVYGMTVEQLRNLVRINPNEPSEAAKLARAHLINAFSMCDAEGTAPRSIDFHSFHGCFTPEFYPRRFALKDSIYSQRLDVLAALIGHIMDRYRTCLPPIKYCELSISANDLSKQWVFDVLRSVRIYDEETIQRVQKTSNGNLYAPSNELSSFSQIVLNGCFPYLQVAFKGIADMDNKNGTSCQIDGTYRFLAGFDRRKIGPPFPTDPDEALQLLYNAPHEAILKMMKEINKSQNNLPEPVEPTSNQEVNDSNSTKVEEKGFNVHLKQLRDIIKVGKKVSCFYTWVVGLDLFGDELGYPYCSFVARPFIKFVWKRRKTNKYFGVRVHGGENVKYINEDSPAYRLFITHMYIVFRCLLFLQKKLKYGIRVGHGIAFNRILNADLNSAKFRKSSVLLAEMQDHVNYLFKKIAFEVNLTSNEYLLGQTLRDADFAQILRLKELFKMKVPIVLATDDDGIWPIDQCPSAHPGHHSLAAEYCRALSTLLIDTDENLLWTFKTMRRFCFSDMRSRIQESFVKCAHSRNSPRLNTIIVHPHIISLILDEYKKHDMTPDSAFKNYKIYRRNGRKSSNENTPTDDNGEDTHELTTEPSPTDNSRGNKRESTNQLKWTNDYGAKRVAFVCICADEEGRNKETLRKIYETLFDTADTLIREFDFIYDHWQNILKDFVNGSTITSIQREINEPSETEPKENIIWSVKSHPEDFEKLLKDVKWSGKEINIYAYINEAKIKQTLDTFKKWYKEHSHEKSRKGTLLLFANTYKYTYAYRKLGKRFKLQLNPHASKRQITKEQDENFLYVLCHHARAVTAALNLISKRISKFAKGTLPSPSHVDKSILLASKPDPYLPDTDKNSETNASAPIEAERPPDLLTLKVVDGQTTKDFDQHDLSQTDLSENDTHNDDDDDDEENI